MSVGRGQYSFANVLYGSCFIVCLLEIILRSNAHDNNCLTSTQDENIRRSQSHAIMHASTDTTPHAVRHLMLFDTVQSYFSGLWCDREQFVEDILRVISCLDVL